MIGEFFRWLFGPSKRGQAAQWLAALRLAEVNRIQPPPIVPGKRLVSENCGKLLASQIKALLKAGISQKCIAWALGVHYKTVSNINNGYCYKGIHAYKGDMDSVIDAIKEEFPDGWAGYKRRGTYAGRHV